jgi:XTP/dITP diphosphohydrolase
MTQQFVLATRNKHKAKELQRILHEQNLKIEILTLGSFSKAPKVVETESTFEGNALLKARAICDHTGLPAIADDSGLCVNSLNGMPGVLSARWSAAKKSIDEENLELVLAQIEDVPDVRRGAQFVCKAVAVFPDGREIIASGTVEGFIVRKPRGKNGFGYDPIFQPIDSFRTTAEMSDEEKDAISHRGKALRDLADQLTRVIS